MYLNLVQIAESFGVSEAVVEGWVRDEGMPHTTDRTRMLFDRAQVVQWAAERGLATRAGFLTPEQSSFATGCQLDPLLRVGGIWRGIRAADVLGTMEKVVTALPGATPPVRQLLAQRLRSLDGIVWAAVGHGFALPHLSARVALGRDSGSVALISLSDALTQASAPDGGPIQHLFFFVAPSPRAHLDLLGRLTRALAQGELRELVVKGASDEAIFAAIRALDAAMGNNRKAPEVKR